MSPLTAFFEITRSKLEAAPTAMVASSTLSSHSKCPRCGEGMIGHKDWTSASASVEGRDANCWPDHIGGWELVFSQRVVNTLILNGATGFIAHPLSLGSIESARLMTLPQPNYYIIEVTGRVDIERQLFDEGEGDWCPVCHKWKPKRNGKYGFGQKFTLPVLDSWDGCDFVMRRNLPARACYCTARVVELVRTEGWTGFGFRSFVPGLPDVDLKSPNWKAEFEEEARLKYPHFARQE